MEQIIKRTNEEIKALIKALEDIQKEITELKDKNKGLEIDDWNKREEASIREIQEEIIKIEITIGRTEIYKEILWKKLSITE
jgi:ABC-type lipopolysaccharide export system ATPase subunit